MKKLLVLMFCFMVLVAYMGCGQKAEEGNTDAAHGAAEEMADSTRMDSAAMDSMSEDMEETMDSTMANDSM